MPAPETPSAAAPAASPPPPEVRRDLAPLFADLGLDVGLAPGVGQSGQALWLSAPAGQAPDAQRSACLAALDPGLGPEDALLLWVEGKPDDPRLAAWRNALWPLVHVTRLFRVAGGKARRQTLQGTLELEGEARGEGVLLAGHRRELVMSPEKTIEKFDANASGWDGTPGSPGYAHFRWMRRYVGLFVEPRDGARILDFGCGAGWVGIEVASRCAESCLAFFDPSPAMVKIAEDNARESGVPRFEGRTGFGEDPPFPANGEEAFDHVISSGVASFSPDLERWLDGLASTVAPGGTLVVGDIHRGSRGFRARRRARPLLPVRELNAITRDEVRAGLERRGFRHQRSAGYQLTWPVPEAMHYSAAKLGGVLNGPLLLANRMASFLDRGLGSPFQGQFDSWVMHLSKDA